VIDAEGAAPWIGNEAEFSGEGGTAASTVCGNSGGNACACHGVRVRAHSAMQRKRQCRNAIVVRLVKQVVMKPTAKDDRSANVLSVGYRPIICLPQAESVCFDGRSGMAVKFPTYISTTLRFRQNPLNYDKWPRVTGHPRPFHFDRFVQPSSSKRLAK
jgi:hypothetical protein